MNSIKNSRNKFQLHNITINFWLMPSNLWLQTSRLETKSTSMPNSYALHVHPKNSPTRMLVHTRLSPSLAHIPLPFDFWIACVPSIWSFMYCSWNLHPEVLSPAKYQLRHLLIEGELEFKISEILISKVDCLHRLCKLLYLVYWSGYEGTDKETSWILASKLICISLDLSLICIFNSYLNLFSYSDSHTLVSELDLQIMIFIYKKKLLSFLIFLGLLLGLLFQLHHFLIQRHLLCWIFFSFFLLL